MLGRCIVHGPDGETELGPGGCFTNTVHWQNSAVAVEEGCIRMITMEATESLVLVLIELKQVQSQALKSRDSDLVAQALGLACPA